MNRTASFPAPTPPAVPRACGDEPVQMHAPGFLLNPGRTYTGIVKVGKRGNVYVHTKAGNFCAFSNPWNKI